MNNDRDAISEDWLSGAIESPIQHPEDDADYDCWRCGELFEFCECPNPVRNEPPPRVTNGAIIRSLVESERKTGR